MSGEWSAVGASVGPLSEAQSGPALALTVVPWGQAPALCLGWQESRQSPALPALPPAEPWLLATLSPDAPAQVSCFSGSTAPNPAPFPSCAPGSLKHLTVGPPFSPVITPPTPLPLFLLSWSFVHSLHLFLSPLRFCPHPAPLQAHIGGNFLTLSLERWAGLGWVAPGGGMVWGMVWLRPGGGTAGVNARPSSLEPEVCPGQ